MYHLTTFLFEPWPKAGLFPGPGFLRQPAPLHNELYEKDPEYTFLTVKHVKRYGLDSEREGDA